MSGRIADALAAWSSDLILDSTYSVSPPFWFIPLSTHLVISMDLFPISRHIGSQVLFF